MMTRIEDLDLERFRSSTFNDNRVLLQGFYWESYRHGNTPPNPTWPTYGNGKRWYEIVKDNAQELREGRFDLIWLPPVCFAGNYSAGYNPKEYFNYSNSYGSKNQHREMLEALLSNGVEPVADVVINHRDGTNHWADFTNPKWDLSSISRDDEFFSLMDAGSFDHGTLVRYYGNDYKTAPRGNSEQRPPYVSHGGTTDQYKDFRDIDHSNPIVRRDILRYLLSLRTLGYRGWRYDMVKGFLADKISLYNRITTPSFSIGEFWDSNQGDLRGWAWHTAIENGRLDTASNVFDFSSYYTLKDNKGNYQALFGYGKGIGLVGDNTDGHPWKNRAMTFLENHDTGYRTKEDGTPQDDHHFDSFANNWEVEQGYAYILTHPGIPSVYWKHYFDWGSELKNKIKALINARKVAGVHAGSLLHTQENARNNGVYAARVDGRFGELFVRIGGDDFQWQPFYSGYHNYREYAYGNGWKVWVKIGGNPDILQFPLKNPFRIPSFTEADEIEIDTSLLYLL